MSGLSGISRRVQNVIEGWKELVVPITNMARALNAIAQSLAELVIAIIAAGAVVKVGPVVFTSNGTLGTVPAGAMIIQATLQETAGHTVSVSLGTSSGGAQILPATSVTASSLVPIPNISMLLQAWGADQIVYVASASWGSASITATLWYTK